MMVLRRSAASLMAAAIVLLARFVTAVHARWQGCEPLAVQRVYFANHCSHADFVLLWTVLPARLRAHTRPVAGADYWLQSALRRFIGRDVFNSVLIERTAARRTDDPVRQMADVLDNGESLILFPEGTRNPGEEPLLPFKSGLYHLSRHRPDVDYIPVWISNLNRVLPKGEIIPIPLVCTVTFGEPLTIIDGESRNTFLERAETALLALSRDSQIQ